MESLYPEFALYGSKNKCARTGTTLFPVAQICTRGVTVKYGIFVQLSIFSDKIPVGLNSILV